MQQEVIAIRYAKALVAAATECGELEQVRQDVALLADFLDPDMGDISVPELREFLKTPTVSLQDKLDMTDELCEKTQIGKLVSDFLNVLIRHRRVQLTGRIVRNYVRLAAKTENVAEALISSAKPLNETERRELAEALEKKIGKKVRLLVGVHKHLIGGIRIKIGDYMLDTSLRGRLDDLAKTLTAS